MTHRIFKPVILFHDHSYRDEISNGITHRIHIPLGDPYYTPLIQQKKQKVGLMLKSNGQAWFDIIQNSRYHRIIHQTPPKSKHNTQLLLQHYSQHSNEVVIKKKKNHEKRTLFMIEQEDEMMTSDSSSITDSSCSTHSTGSPIPTATTTARKRRGNLPKIVTAVLKQWLIDHCRNPYPTEAEKTGLKDKTGLTLNQISNWFINARRRLLPQILQEIVSPSAVSAAATTTSNKKKRRVVYHTDKSHMDEQDIVHTTVVRRRRRYNKRSSA